MSEQLYPTSIPEVIAPPRQPLMLADAGVIGSAVLDVLDDGWRCSLGCDIRHGWHFHPEDNSEEETDNRTRFVDAVRERIRVLQGPTFNLGVKLENYCSTHKAMRLPEPTSSWCADCEAERARR